MILQSKNLLVFAASGAIGSGVAQAFAREGAHVWLSGRNHEALVSVANSVRAVGGQATVHVVDATHESEVDAYVERVAQETGRIDGVFNGIGARPADLGYPERTAETSFEHFMLPLQTILGSTFLTSRAVGRVLTQQGSGAIVTLSATLSGMAAPFMAGISATCAAIEGLTRSLAGEHGPAGVRVNCVRGSGMPETRTIQETGMGYVNLGYAIPMALPPLGRPITVAETANTAAFLMSDHASGMTGQVVTVCAGAFVG